MRLVTSLQARGGVSVPGWMNPFQGDWSGALQSGLPPGMTTACVKDLAGRLIHSPNIDSGAMKNQSRGA